jgi:tetraacyldisaccharide 4'-kinase
MNIVFSGISALYALVLVLRHYLYDKHYLPIYKAPSFVVSIGNIVCGGTGKTPLIQKLVHDLRGAVRAAVVAKGYKAIAGKGKDPVNVSALLRQGKAEPSFVGDEPYIIASTTDAEVFVSSRKWKSAKYAAESGYALIIIDDGMQHRRLQKNIEIVIIDARDPLGGGALLPKGYLRELPSRLSHADLIAVSYAEDLESFAAAEKTLRPYTKAPLVQLKRKVTVQKDLTGVSVGLFCGIAKPCYFQCAVEKLGAHIVASLLSPDHELPKYDELVRFASDCKDKGARALICTEKDFVKLPKDLNLPLEVIPAFVEIELAQGADLWQDLLVQCKSLKKRKSL